MASRQQQVVAVHQQQRGVPAMMGKQHKPPVADGNKNRKALGDIGNLANARTAAAVPEGKPVPPINRPVTRSFRAQLLRNAQVTAQGAVVSKKPLKIDQPVEGVAAAAKGAVKPRQKAAVTVPKPEAVAVALAKTEAPALVAQAPAVSETASVAAEVVIIASNSSRKKAASRRKVHTLTSVLTARSKVACGISDKPKEVIRDIDGPDAGDQLAIVEYVEDIYNFYKMAERSNRPNPNYMDSQAEVNARMRAILADWLVEVHLRFELMPEVLYLTLYIIDKYLSSEAVSRRELQLLGISAMLIACKYEEIWAPEVNDFICVSDRAYTREQILGMEKTVLNALEWNLTVPTPYVFLVRFVKAAAAALPAAAADKELEHMAFFLAELGVAQYSTVRYSPSMLAASAVYAARCELGRRPLWDDTLRLHTGFDEPEIQECTRQLAGFHAGAAESKLKVVFTKYSSPRFGSVALRSTVNRIVEEDGRRASSSSS